jgi:hypothetical protein
VPSASVNSRRPRFLIELMKLGSRKTCRSIEVRQLVLRLLRKKFGDNVIGEVGEQKNKQQPVHEDPAIAG